MYSFCYGEKDRDIVTRDDASENLNLSLLCFFVGNLFLHLHAHAWLAVLNGEALLACLIAVRMEYSI